ncbi:hypothetical protein HK097_002686, partial [Rhizophlyctis rosea]
MTDPRTQPHRFYVIRSYAHFCFFEQIQNSRKTVDILAFYVFFTFRGWKRLLLAEFPRALLNGFNLYDHWDLQTRCKRDTLGNKIATTQCWPSPTEANTQICECEKVGGNKDVSEYLKDILTQTSDKTQLATTYLTIFSVTLWAISAIQLLIAVGVYLPLLCRIRGNLKEYCCHKIDKRIGELLRRKSRKRQDQARKAELKGVSDTAKYGRGPTLPDVGAVDLSSKPQQYAYYDEYGQSVDPSEVASYHNGSNARSAGGGGYYPPGPGSGYTGSQAGSYYPPPQQGPGSHYAGSNWSGSHGRSGPAPGYTASPVPPLPQGGYIPPLQQGGYAPADPYARSEYDGESDYGSDRSHSRAGSVAGGSGLGPAGSVRTGMSTPNYSPQYSTSPPPPPQNTSYTSAPSSAFRDSIYTTIDAPHTTSSPLPPIPQTRRQYQPYSHVTHTTVTTATTQP